jgi:diguanylate cyclase (GGDEF)-like protein/PAS domain S-box-containing protein
VGIVNPESQPVLIFGGGRGGSAFVELFTDEELFHVVGIVDRDPNAPAFKLAEKLNIPTFGNAIDALNACQPCTVFNLTRDESVSELAVEIIGPSCVIGGLEAKLIWQMVTQLKDTRDELKKSQILTQSIISNAMEGIILIDTRGIIKSFNPAAELMFGYTQEEVTGKNISMLMPEPVKSAHDGYLHRYMTTREPRVIGIEREVIALRKDGRTFPMSLSSNEMTSEDECYFVGIVSDISERKNNEEVIKKMAHYDAVTNLPNRTLFFDRLQNSLAQAKRYKQKLAILFLDLDGFKSVNDTLGHIAGDALLKEVATRLLKAIREVDTVARFGGDEFALFLNDVKNKKNTALVAKKILAGLSEPFIINGEKCNIGGSIGISIFPDDHVDIDSLIKQADTAMYAVKNSGKNNYHFFEKNMEPK